MRPELAGRVLFFAVACAAGLALGCASGTAGPGLERARALHDEVVASTEIASHAPVELYEAQKAFGAAEQAYERGSSAEKVAHLTYIAERRLEIARFVAKEMAAVRRADRLSDQRKEIALLRRAREGERASAMANVEREEALARARDAERALEDALAMMADAERAREAAMARAAEAELVRRRALAEAAAAEEARREVAEEAARRAQAPAAAPLSPPEPPVELLFEDVMEELALRETDQGLLLTLRGDAFSSEDDALRPEARRLLVPLAGFLREHAHRKVQIDAFGSEPGRARARADAVRRFLAEHGIRPARLSTRQRATAQSTGAPQAPERLEIVILEAEHLTGAAGTGLEPGSPPR